MIPLSWYLIFAAALFSIGLVRRAVPQERRRDPARHRIDAECGEYQPGWPSGATATSLNMTGQVFAIIVFAVAAAEVAVGLALVISVYRRRNTVVADEIDMMKW